MMERVTRGPINSQGRDCFYPLETLPIRIINYSIGGSAVKISFRPEGIFLHNADQVIPFSQRLSKDLFQRSSISDITFRPNIKDMAVSARNIKEFLVTGDTRYVKGTLIDITILPPVEQVLMNEGPILNTPFLLGAIPGEFKHYTDFTRFNSILGDQKINAVSGKRARSPRLCFTNLSLTPDRVCDYFFSGSKIHANDSRGDYVFGFNLTAAARESLEQPKPGSPEYWLRGNVEFGRNAELVYAGLSPLAYSAVA